MRIAYFFGNVVAKNMHGMSIKECIMQKYSI
jgi:hypothetical protein